MSVTGERLVAKLRKQFEQRDDMTLVDAGDPDQPAIVGILRRLYTVSRTTESTFQTYNRTADEDHGIGFCVETRLDPEGNLTKKALKWRDWWVGLGCVHSVGRDEETVYRELGIKPL